MSMRMKLSHDKATYPGAKQIWRLTDKNGKYASDLIALADEEPPSASSGELVDSARPLLEPAMKQGRVLEDFALKRSDQADEESVEMTREARFTRLNHARDNAQRDLRCLPKEVLALDSRAQYPVVFSERLRREKEKLEQLIVGTRS